MSAQRRTRGGRSSRRARAGRGEMARAAAEVLALARRGERGTAVPGCSRPERTDLLRQPRAPDGAERTPRQRPRTRGVRGGRTAGTCDAPVERVPCGRGAGVGRAEGGLRGPDASYTTMAGWICRVDGSFAGSGERVGDLHACNRQFAALSATKSKLGEKASDASGSNCGVRSTPCVPFHQWPALQRAAAAAKFLPWGGMRFAATRTHKADVGAVSSLALQAGLCSRLGDRRGCAGGRSVAPGAERLRKGDLTGPARRRRVQSRAVRSRIRRGAVRDV